MMPQSVETKTGYQNFPGITTFCAALLLIHPSIWCPYSASYQAWRRVPGLPGGEISSSIPVANIIPNLVSGQCATSLSLTGPAPQTATPLCFCPLDFPLMKGSMSYTHPHHRHTTPATTQPALAYENTPCTSVLETTERRTPRNGLVQVTKHKLYITEPSLSPNSLTRSSPGTISIPSSRHLSTPLR